MSMSDKIKSKSYIDIDMFIERLKNELSISKIENEDKKKTASEQLEYAIYDTLIIILDVTHQEKVPEGLYTTWLRMIKDYWYLNQYDKQLLSDDDDNSNSNVKVKSIQIGDTTTTLADTSSQIEINGITYDTGKIEFSDDILIEKYKKDLYRHRKMGWK